MNDVAATRVSGVSAATAERVSTFLRAVYGWMCVGLGVTAYTLGMRHAFDADHIAAIDNTTRKLMSYGRRPLSVLTRAGRGTRTGRAA